MSDVLRAQITVAKTTLQAIACGAGGDAKSQAETALKNIEALATSKETPQGCPYCAKGMPRIKFNSLYTHDLGDGNEVH